MPKEPSAYRAPNDVPRPRLLLVDHHAELEGACADLRACACADASRELVAQFRAFERAVLEHIDAEEEQILDAYEEFDAEDAQQIRRQHAALRGQLFQLAIDAELHCVRGAQLEQLIGALRAHAAHEDARMYPWAQVHLSPPAHRALFMRIGRSLRELARGRARHRAMHDADKARRGGSPW